MKRSGFIPWVELVPAIARHAADDALCIGERGFECLGLPGLHIEMGYLEDGQGRFPIDPSIDLQRFQLVDISQEPAGDQDFRHSGKSMLRGKLPV